MVVGDHLKRRFLNFGRPAIGVGRPRTDRSTGLLGPQMTQECNVVAADLIGLGYDDGGGATTSLGCRAAKYLALGDVGFRKYSIDLRLATGRNIPRCVATPRKALQNARNALDRSVQPDCQYAWGMADGLHWCGMAHLRLGERELARQRLTAALEIRERLGHGGIEETRSALDHCQP